MHKKVRIKEDANDNSWSNTLKIAGIITAIIVVSVAVFYIFGETEEESPSNDTVEQAVIQPETILKIHGSNTLGASLIPELAEKFLQSLGATRIHRVQGNDPVEVKIVGNLPGETVPRAIEIEAHGSRTAFSGVANFQCEIGASSRPISNAENEQLMANNFGDMKAPENEHVVALDGVAVIVHPSNPLVSASVENIAKVFSGEITDWSELSAPVGPINLYVRDLKSGTYDTFKSLVLGKDYKLSSWAKRFEDSHALYEAVMSDRRSIGFVGLPYILSAKALAVREDATRAFKPSKESIKSEVYPLSRRLYLYTARFNRNTYVEPFIKFALSDRGQSLVEVSNLVNLSLEQKDTHTTREFLAGEAYQALSQRAQLLVTVRFKSGAGELDNRGIEDLERFVNLMRRENLRNIRIFLVGHSDGVGDATTNHVLSLERAQSILERLSDEINNPMQVIGFGKDAPVAGNDTPTGRQRNRRVEIFIGEGP